MNRGDLTRSVAGVLARAPRWIRTDLCASDPALRTRAEEALAAIIAAALTEDRADGDEPAD